MIREAEGRLLDGGGGPGTFLVREKTPLVAVLSVVVEGGGIKHLPVTTAGDGTKLLATKPIEGAACHSVEDAVQHLVGSVSRAIGCRLVLPEGVEVDLLRDEWVTVAAYDVRGAPPDLTRLVVP